MKIFPKNNQVLIKRKKVDVKSSSGLIHIPDSAQEKSAEGEVLAVGPGKTLDSGFLVKPEVAQGDMVVFEKHMAREIEVEGEKYILINEDNILLALQPAPIA